MATNIEETLFYNGEFSSLISGWNAGEINDAGNLVFSGNAPIEHRSTSAIDVTECSSLEIAMDNYSCASSRTAVIGLFDLSGNSILTQDIIEDSANTYIFDISTLFGSYYIGISQASGDYYDLTYTISKISLIKNIKTDETTHTFAVNNVKPRYINVDIGANRYKCKRVNCNAVKVWSGEETLTTSLTNAYYTNWGEYTTDSDGDGINDSGWSEYTDNWSDYTIGSIDIPVGDTFRIDSVNVFGPSSSSTNVQILVNNTSILSTEWTGLGDVNYRTFGPYPNDAIYVSTQNTGTIQYKIRGKVSALSWDSTAYGTLNITYTIGI